MARYSVRQPARPNWQRRTSVALVVLTLLVCLGLLIVGPRLPQAQEPLPAAEGTATSVPPNWYQRRSQWQPLDQQPGMNTNPGY